MKFLLKLVGTSNLVCIKFYVLRVLMADPGNTRTGVDKSDPSLLLLGTEESPAAHLVISRQFSHNRGW